MTSSRRTFAPRRAACVTATVVALGGLTACGGTTPDRDTLTGTDLEGIEEQIGGLDDRIAELEDGLADGGPDGSSDAEGGGGLLDDPEELLNDPGSFLDEEVTVSGEVSELWTTTGTGTAFAVVGAGEPVAVVSTEAVEGIEADDEVEVSGTVRRLDPATFQDDFGIALDELFEDPDGFVSEIDGQVVIDATSVELLGASDS